MSWLPLYHDMGLIGAWLGSLCVGFPLVLMSPVSFLVRPARWLRAISDYRATLSAAPNFGFDLCARKIPRRRTGGSRALVAANGVQRRRTGLRRHPRPFPRAVRAVRTAPSRRWRRCTGWPRRPSGSRSRRPDGPRSSTDCTRLARAHRSRRNRSAADALDSDAGRRMRAAVARVRDPSGRPSRSRARASDTRGASSSAGRRRRRATTATRRRRVGCSTVRGSTPVISDTWPTVTSSSRGGPRTSSSVRAGTCTPRSWRTWSARSRASGADALPCSRCQIPSRAPSVSSSPPRRTFMIRRQGTSCGRPSST